MEIAYDFQEQRTLIISAYESGGSSEDASIETHENALMIVRVAVNLSHLKAHKEWNATTIVIVFLLILRLSPYPWLVQNCPEQNERAE